MDFEEFRDLMEMLYEEFNSQYSIRVAPPTDVEKLHMLMAIEAYFLLLEEKTNDFFPGDRWDEMLGL